MKKVPPNIDNNLTTGLKMLHLKYAQNPRIAQININ